MLCLCWKQKYYFHKPDITLTVPTYTERPIPKKSVITAPIDKDSVLGKASVISVKGDSDTIMDFQQACESRSAWARTKQGTYLYFQRAFVQLSY